ncbi:MAG: S-layer homology domain-containing protein, partial [Oscillospiraceae bacterium]|nr:S-layer homology domain-containing protein [Oscillospiraceae bacterium]
MRNLKKILALVLALVMSLSLMATASAAETTAAGNNPYATAQSVLEKLRVFKGDDTGSMSYDRSITRAETAALVYRVATGDVTDALAGLHSQNPFTDSNVGQWFNPYISYCYTAEILKGNGDNTVSPSDPVTGYQVLVMLLRTLGYGKNNEFVGLDWPQNTANRAQALGLLNHVAPADQTPTALGQPASRGMVAEILFRSILTETVQYSPLIPGQYVGTGKTLGEEQFGLNDTIGVVMANEWANLEGGSVIAAGTTKMKKADGSYVTVDATTPLDAVGMTYKAYVADNPDGGST